MEWKPIETAPAGRIMVCDKEWFGPAQKLSNGGYMAWCSFFEPWDVGKDRLNHRPNCIYPTHWSPLPETPK